MPGAFLCIQPQGVVERGLLEFCLVRVGLQEVASLPHQHQSNPPPQHVRVRGYVGR